MTLASLLVVIGVGLLHAVWHFGSPRRLGGSPRLDTTLEPEAARALRVSGWLALGGGLWQSTASAGPGAGLARFAASWMLAACVLALLVPLAPRLTWMSFGGVALALLIASLVGGPA